MEDDVVAIGDDGGCSVVAAAARTDDAGAPATDVFMRLFGISHVHFFHDNGGNDDDDDDVCSGCGCSEVGKMVKSIKHKKGKNPASTVAARLTGLVMYPSTRTESHASDSP